MFKLSLLMSKRQNLDYFCFQECVDEILVTPVLAAIKEDVLYLYSNFSSLLFYTSGRLIGTFYII